MKTELARLTVKELTQLKWLMGGLLTLLSLWALWSLDFQIELFLLIGTVVVGLALFRPAWIARIPSKVWRFVGPALLVIIVADFLIHVPRSAEFLPPLVRMVILLLLYRCLAPRSRREDLQLILLCLFCVVLSGVLTVSLLFGLQILLFMPVTMGLLFILCLLRNDGGESVATVFDADFRCGALFGRVRRVIDYKFLGFGGFLFLCMVLISTGLFVLIPRFNLEQAIPYLKLSSQAKSGFSSDVRLGDVSEIRNDRAIALQIDVPSFDAMVARPYWRMLVLDQYDNGYFRVSFGLKDREYQHQRFRKERVLGGWDRWRVPYTERNEEVWTVYMEGGISEYLPLPGPFASIRFPTAQEFYQNDALLTLNTQIVQQSVFSYQINDLKWSDRVPATLEEVEVFASVQTDPGSAVEDSTYPLSTLQVAVLDADLEYLQSVNETLLRGETDLAADVYGHRVMQHLERGHSYTLNPIDGFGEGDEVVRWMRSGAAGHCEYFAGSMILLARAAGYPARMAVGFMGGSWNSVESYFVVRNSDAHAWVEIYDATSEQWIRMDPTPGNGPADPSQSLASQIAIESGWSAWVDSLRIQWYRRVVNFDQAEQAKLADTAKSVFQRISTATRELKEALLERFNTWLERIQVGGGFWSMLPLFLVMGLLLFLWLARNWLRLGLFRLLKRKPSFDPRRQRASLYLRRLNQKCDLAEMQGVSPPEQLLICQAQLESIRFGPETDPAMAEACFRRVRSALRMKLNPDNGIG